MPLYFAYGSNMHVGQMSFRCPASRPVGRARLLDWRFRINQRGVATIVPERGAEVFGVVWHSTPDCVATLNIYEGIAQRHYRQRRVRIFLDGEEAHKPALTYVSLNTRAGRPQRGYHDRVVVPGAYDWSFPSEYLEELETWLHR